MLATKPSVVLFHTLWIIGGTLIGFQREQWGARFLPTGKSALLGPFFREGNRVDGALQLTLPTGSTNGSRGLVDFIDNPPLPPKGDTPSG